MGAEEGSSGWSHEGFSAPGNPPFVRPALPPGLYQSLGSVADGGREACSEEVPGGRKEPRYWMNSWGLKSFPQETRGPSMSKQIVLNSLCRKRKMDFYLCHSFKASKIFSLRNHQV